MNDERFERDLTLVLRDIAGAEAPMSLRYRLSTIAETAPAGRRSWFAPLLGTAAVAATIIVAVAALGWLLQPPPIIGPLPTATPVPSASPNPSASPTPMPSASPPQPPSPTPTPSPSGWTSLAWSGGVAPTAVEGTSIHQVVAWQGGYVAIGLVTRPGDVRHPAFLTSPDALHWTIAQELVLREGRYLTDLVALSDRLLAVASGGGVACVEGSPCPIAELVPDLFSSSDGAHWTAVDSPSWRDAWSLSAPLTMVAGDAGVIAVGYVGYPPAPGGGPPPVPVPSVPLIVHSTDGITWQRADLSTGFEQAVLRDATAYPGGFVVVGRDGQRDPRNEVPDPASPDLLGLGRPAAWVSADGVHWSVGGVDGVELAGGELSRVVAGSGGLFAVGVGAPAAGTAPCGWSSADGRTWHVIGRVGVDLPALDLDPRAPAFTVLAADGDHIVVLDRAASGVDTMTAWVSDDGARWSRLAFTGVRELPKIGDYAADGASGMYVTGAAVLPDGLLVWAYGTTPTRVWRGSAAGG
jgi:hypothetical protein